MAEIAFSTFSSTLLNGTQMVPSGLENLPFEIRIQILWEVADFPSLRSLIRASPLYHATYLEEGRERVLRDLALKQLDYRLRPDALAAVRSARYYATPRRKRQTIGAFLDEYGRARGQLESDSEWLSCTSMTEAIDLVHLHEAVKRVSEDFCFEIASKMPQEEQFIDLSQMEQLRLYRGMYRYQTYCNFFGKDKSWSQEDNFGADWPPLLPRDYYLPTFPPWEVQEIACVWQYVNRRWASILQEVSDVYLPKQFSRDGSNGSDMEETCEYLRLTSHEPSDGTSFSDPLLPKSSMYVTDILRGSSDEMRKDSRHGRSEYLKYRQFAACSGPKFLFRALTPGTLESRLELAKYAHAFRWTDNLHADMNWYRTGLRHPADIYEDQDIIPNLSGLPEAEQPSGGWEWFCHKHHLGSLGIGGYFGNMGRIMTGIAEDSNGYELSWGYPFWDKEKLDKWGMTMSY